MWRSVKVSTKPTASPITLPALKTRVRVDFADDDTLLQSYLDGAVQRIDGPTGIGYAMMTQAWELSLDTFPSVICLPGAPVSAVNSIKYYDADNTLQTLSSDEYRLDIGGDQARIEPVDSWPGVYSRFGAIQVNYQLGAATAADVPADLIDAVCLLVAHRYEQRQPVVVGASVATLPMGFESITAEYNRLAVA